jgi:hypothetical protein
MTPKSSCSKIRDKTGPLAPRAPEIVGEATPEATLALTEKVGAAPAALELVAMLEPPERAVPRAVVVLEALLGPEALLVVTAEKRTRQATLVLAVEAVERMVPLDPEAMPAARAAPVSPMVVRMPRTAEMPQMQVHPTRTAGLR